MEKILLVGGGGHCKSIIDSIRNNNEFTIAGIIDPSGIGNRILDINVIGEDKDLKDMYYLGYKNAFISVGSIGNPNIRIRLYNILKDIGYNLPPIIDRSAIISPNIKIEEGVFIGKGAIVNVGSVIGKGSIINSGAIIDHDCIINEFVHIAPGATLSGSVTIGKYSHIGTNATVIQGRSIGENVMVGAGSVIVRNIGDNQKVYGNPGREIL